MALGCAGAVADAFRPFFGHPGPEQMAYGFMAKTIFAELMFGMVLNGDDVRVEMGQSFSWAESTTFHVVSRQTLGPPH